MTAAHSDNERRMRILHVDDHAINRRLIAEILASFGHVSVEASGGTQALEALDRQPFDAVLMDINMPGMSGLETLRRLRAIVGPARHTPVVALTSEVGRSEADYRALSFDGFVSKPFRIPDLLDAIGACVRPRPASRTASTPSVADGLPCRISR